MFKAAAEKFFHLIHGNRLIYNTCWEDPRIDRQLLQLDATSNIVVITSAGCNVLDYLLDNPAAIHAVDMNFRQNALLELKMAFFAGGTFEDLLALFGRGGDDGYQQRYQAVRHLLSGQAQEFWDKKIHYFSGRGIRKSFYWRGAAGDFAWLLRRFLRANGRAAGLDALLEARTLARQQECYRALEKKVFTPTVAWLLRQPGTMALVGVPRAQIRLIDATHPRGLSGFVQDKLARVMTTLPLRDNYFWRVYLTGSYTPDCCPNYLKAANFPRIRATIARVKTYTGTVTDFLHHHPGTYSHFVLLDHQDWLAWHQPQALAAEWEAIFQRSRPGTKILLRSAGLNLDFLPERVTSRLRFFPSQSAALHGQDRVGTYGSLHLAEVR